MSLPIQQRAFLTTFFNALPFLIEEISKMHQNTNWDGNEPDSQPNNYLYWPTSSLAFPKQESSLLWKFIVRPDNCSNKQRINPIFLVMLHEDDGVVLCKARNSTTNKIQNEATNLASLLSLTDEHHEKGSQQHWREWATKDLFDEILFWPTNNDQRHHSHQCHRRKQKKSIHCHYFPGKPFMRTACAEKSFYFVISFSQILLKDNSIMFRKVHTFMRVW